VAGVAGEATGERASGVLASTVASTRKSRIVSQVARSTPNCRCASATDRVRLGAFKKWFWMRVISDAMLRTDAMT
jgi:hypothetical protein